MTIEPNGSPLSDDYRRLTGYVGGHDDPLDPADVLAMQMVLRIEKSDPPDRAELLVAAARAVALLCLDDRAGRDGPWAPSLDAWCDARIRKIARRARGAQWLAAQEVWGVTAGEGAAQARALVPGRVGDVDRRISRLQIGGTEVDGGLPADPPTTGVCLWVNPDLEMTVGKLAAQVGHASMLAVRLLDEASTLAWRESGCPLSVCVADSVRWRSLLAADASGAAVAVRDAGFTEIAPGSVTVIAEVTR
ncbi:peptidyl-tRNA hydrolase [Gordonia sp. ABSL49_1]|uniref:peptidyl-tRNA hydrolase n=1 Tax=unclassified Gordonia (in: high G+C Gram-positive bacteria) TaxID=2657482 RepID=UPI001F0E38E6|nr:peptidyl-tRNA hydrolase [Gordonia sp. ABSL49_1]MCH5642988.1 peptidyl-tRNA hydrolase [Gordonia sp. ABSL49_1]